MIAYTRITGVVCVGYSNTGKQFTRGSSDTQKLIGGTEGSEIYNRPLNWRQTYNTGSPKVTVMHPSTTILAHANIQSLTEWFKSCSLVQSHIITFKERVLCPNLLQWMENEGFIIQTKKHKSLLSLKSREIID